MAKGKGKKEEVVEEVAEVVDVVIEKPLPPPVYPGKPRGQNVEHPSTIGYVRGETGTISLDVTRLHPAMAGKVWVKAPNVQIDDPRIAHPSALGYRVDLNAQGCDMDFSRFNPVFVAPGMTVDTTPPPPPEPRPLIPLKAASAEGKYLEEKVWPTLETGLEKVLNAIKYYIPDEIKAQYPQPADSLAPLSPLPTPAEVLAAGGRPALNRSEAVWRVEHPEHAKGFDPLLWLATYLRRYNPNTPSKFTPHSAARRIQSVYRGFLGRQKVRRLRADLAATAAAIELERRRNKAATLIQATYRGNVARASLALGRTDDFDLNSSGFHAVPSV